VRGMIMVLAMSAAAAGCSKPAADAGSNTTNAGTAPVAAAPAAPAAAVVTPGPPGPITLAQLPAPTAGKWARVSTQNGKSEPPSSKCLNGRPIDPLDGMKMPCSKMDARRTAGGGFVVIAACANGAGIEAKLKLSGEGDFARRFSTDATLDMTGGPGGGVHIKNHSAWTYAGPSCAGVPS